MIKHINIHVSGKVQGVWFRRSTLEKAQALGVTGFVKNQPDGSVYIEAEGSEDIVHQLLDWCRRGPEHAEVDEVNTTEREVVGFADFKIR